MSRCFRGYRRKFPKRVLMHVFSSRLVRQKILSRKRWPQTDISGLSACLSRCVRLPSVTVTGSEAIQIITETSKVTTFQGFPDRRRNRIFRRDMGARFPFLAPRHLYPWPLANSTFSLTDRTNCRLHSCPRFLQAPFEIKGGRAERGEREEAKSSAPPTWETVIYIICPWIEAKGESKLLTFRAFGAVSWPYSCKPLILSGEFIHGVLFYFRIS